jgi:hypothetical protein
MALRPSLDKRYGSYYVGRVIIRLGDKGDWFCVHVEGKGTYCVGRTEKVTTH